FIRQIRVSPVSRCARTHSERTIRSLLRNRAKRTWSGGERSSFEWSIAPVAVCSKRMEGECGKMRAADYTLKTVFTRERSVSTTGETREALSPEFAVQSGFPNRPSRDLAWLAPHAEPAAEARN